MEKLKRKMALRMVSLVDKLAQCDGKDIPVIFRELNESVQEYCTFMTLVNKYAEEQTDEKSDNK